MEGIPFGWVGAILIGIIAGWIAERVMNRNHGLLTNLIVGLVGALIGGFIADALNIALEPSWLNALVFATLGAIVLLFILGVYVWAAATLAERLPDSTPVQLAYFALVGTLWGVPLFPLITWIQSGRW